MSLVQPRPDTPGGSAGDPPNERDMAWVPAGAFIMGSDHHYPEERPARRVHLDGFWIDRAPVTNGEFARFVEATGHVTFAEIAPRAEDYPGAPPENLKAGSMVFQQTEGPVPLDQPYSWWAFIHGADWRHPTGPDSSIEGMADHPVVHVALSDIDAYAAWAGVTIPTEAEWEYAARGGRDDTEFAWGEELSPGGRPQANIWQGTFPYHNSLEDGWLRTSPVGTYPPNGYGLYDMIGNTWEWTCDWWSMHPLEHPQDVCCSVKRAASAAREDPLHIPRRVLKGGSHLCAPSYCRRYRPPARHAHPIDTSTSHVGFRCVVRPESDAPKG